MKTTKDYIYLLIFTIAAASLSWYLVGTAHRAIADVDRIFGASISPVEASRSLVPSSAILQTGRGDIVIEFLPNVPNTVLNFTKLAGTGFYDGTKFHRVIEDFMIQGGDPFSRDDSLKSRWGQGGPGYTFDDEPSNVALERGIVAMANSGPNTNGSQFFIITAEETPWLNGKHTPFARVVEGMGVADAISRAETTDNDIPVNPVVLERVVLE